MQDDTAKFIANSILNQLSSGKSVLFFVTGGSGIEVGVKVSKILEKESLENLTVTLTDERYGPVGHKDSNWQQLLDKGFDLPGAKLVPVLTGVDTKTTTQKFNQALNRELTKDSYKIGLFGIGADGHTAGILPGSGAVNSPDLAYNYQTPQFERITITPRAIMELDQAIVYAKGKEKWKTLGELQTDQDINIQPAQILKTVPLLTMFTDYKNNQNNLE